MRRQTLSSGSTTSKNPMLVRRLGVVTLVVMLMSLALLWIMGSLTALAQQPPQPAAESTENPGFTIVKTVSQDGAAPGTVLTFTLDIYNDTTVSGTVEGFDQIPPDMEEPMGIVADANFANAIYNGQTGALEFEVLELEPGRGARLVYRTAIRPEAKCGADLVNKAELKQNDTILDIAETYVRVICSDLGDAPASDNHFDLKMDALSGVEAHYPTVYHPPSGAPSGPLHHRADLMHLGERVSFERQADIGPDGDPTNNILPPVDTPDRDFFDDGLLNAGRLLFQHCQPATLELLVYMDPVIVQDLEHAFVNVWFDGNRDGDWADVNACENAHEGLFPEHIVIDHPVSVNAGTQTILVTTTVPVFNLAHEDPTWLRVTLSEQRSAKIGKVDSLEYGDGQGVFTTLVSVDSEGEVAGFKLGETEDYLWPQPVPPPPLVIDKSVDPTQANFDDELAYTIQVTNTHANAHLVAVYDRIPPGTTFVSGSFHPNPPGLTSGYDAIHDAIFWLGELGAEESVVIEFNVQVTRCAPEGFRVLNRALGLVRGFQPAEADAVTDITPCDHPPRRIKVTKAASLQALAGGKIEFTLAAQSSIPNPVQLVVVDPLPLGVWVNEAELPNELDFVTPNLIRWKTEIGPDEDARVDFYAHVHEWACSERRLFNQAFWWSPIGLSGHSNSTWTDVVCPDLGDAPDSTFNHHNMTNTAYTLAGTTVVTPLVPGRFPTVWQADYTEGAPSGPRHLDANAAWLGRKVSFELEADKHFDTDGLNNILAFEQDNADNDRFDDGWLNPEVPLPDCQEATLKVRVSKGHYTADRMWLNVWFDGNRDGDWEDWKFCSNDQRKAFEWIVQNHMVDMSTWPVGTSREIQVRTSLVMNDYPARQAWMRFTLSESKPPRNPVTGLADGRGPDYDHQYLRGETEDYQAPAVPWGTPGDLDIDKGASALTVTVGQVYTYGITLTHTGGDGPAFVVMTDVLPAEVEMVGRPTVTELKPSASPLVAYFNSHVGPSGAVGWRGALSPDAAVRIDFPVRVIHCPPIDPPAIRNEAVAHLLHTSLVLPDVVETPVDCTPPPPPDFDLRKYIVTDLNEWAADWSTVPGKYVAYRLVLSGTTAVTRTVHISDPMDSGVIAMAASATSGVAQIIHGGRLVVWDGQFGPASEPVAITIRVKLREVHCDAVVENQAFWATRFYHGESNIVRLRLGCSDLGDAPDSSNHFNVDMTAYPGVTATFPTVFTGTTPLLPHGPIHLHPQPVHLGPRVSFEIEADRGIDLDGINNIKPWRDKPNLDKADDGLKLDELGFAHCELHTFPVLINVNPTPWAAASEERRAYLNVWLDSNRDGDWADDFECQVGTVTFQALEHIVIDQSVDLAALGPGLHRIFVTTTHPVSWPDDQTGPAWLRATLSERESNKTLPTSCVTPNCTYGDGRGYADPFVLGETEDYLLRGPGNPDPAVEKRGFIHPWFNINAESVNDRLVWSIGWSVHYKNAGEETAKDVQVVDTLSSDQKLVRVWTYPHVSPEISGTTVTFTVGELNPGKHGHIFIRSSVPFSTSPGTILTNTVIITGHKDANLDNNSQVVTVTVPLLPPSITYPRSGATCTDLFTITGRVHLPGATVEVYINHTLVASVPADAQGQWVHPVDLPDGTYKIQARAKYGTLTSPFSRPVKVVVDTSMVWSPLSLRFVSQTGHVVLPKDESGFMGEDGWFVFLRPGVTYTVTVYTCCDDPNAEVTLALPDGSTIVLEDPDDDNWYVGAFTMPQDPASLESSSIIMCVVCQRAKYCSEGKVLIDPEGVVFDVDLGQESGLLEDAAVACYEEQIKMDGGEASSILWPAESYDQVNPQTTAADGYFSFFTPAGVYQLDVAKEGYQPYRSWDLVVVAEPVEFNVPLTPETSEQADHTVLVSESGYEPSVLTVKPGDIIEWINVGDEIHTTSSTTPTTHLEGLRLMALGPTDGWDSGLLESGDSYKRRLTSPGSYTYYDHENTAYTGLVVVEGATLYLPIVMRSG
jgi:uncharacterized repeat protein (TIGR01451 family)